MQGISSATSFSAKYKHLRNKHYSEMKRKIIGARVRLLATVKNRGGQVINKGEEATIVQSYRGYGVRTDDRREIHRIDRSLVEFIEQ